MIEEDAGPIAVLKLEEGPADPAIGADARALGRADHAGQQRRRAVAVRRVQVSAPDRRQQVTWPRTRCRRRPRSDVDYGLYTFTLNQTGAGTPADPATFTLGNLTFLYNDPSIERVRRAAAGAAPEAAGHPVDGRPQRSTTACSWRRTCSTAAPTTARSARSRGVDPIDSIAVIAARPTVRRRDERLLGQRVREARADRLRAGPAGRLVPHQGAGQHADQLRHARQPRAAASWSSARTCTCGRARSSTKCVGCHEDRAAGGPVPTNPNPMAAHAARARPQHSARRAGRSSTTSRRSARSSPPSA